MTKPVCVKYSHEPNPGRQIHVCKMCYEKIGFERSIRHKGRNTVLEVMNRNLEPEKLMMNQIFGVHGEELIFQTLISRKTFQKVRNGLSVLFRTLIKELS